MHYCENCFKRDVCASNAEAFQMDYNDNKLYDFMHTIDNDCEYYIPNSSIMIKPVNVGESVWTINKRGTYNSNWEPCLVEKVVTEVSDKQSSGEGFVAAKKDAPWEVANRFKFTSIGKSVFNNYRDALNALDKVIDRKNATKK